MRFDQNLPLFLPFEMLGTATSTEELQTFLQLTDMTVSKMAFFFRFYRINFEKNKFLLGTCDKIPCSRCEMSIQVYKLI